MSFRRIKKSISLTINWILVTTRKIDIDFTKADIRICKISVVLIRTITFLKTEKQPTNHGNTSNIYRRKKNIYPPTLKTAFGAIPLISFGNQANVAGETNRI